MTSSRPPSRALASATSQAGSSVRYAHRRPVKRPRVEVELVDVAAALVRIGEQGALQEDERPPPVRRHGGGLEPLAAVERRALPGAEGGVLRRAHPGQRHRRDRAGGRSDRSAASRARTRPRSRTSRSRASRIDSGSTSAPVNSRSALTMGYGNLPSGSLSSTNPSTAAGPVPPPRRVEVGADPVDAQEPVGRVLLAPVAVVRKRPPEPGTGAQDAGEALHRLGREGRGQPVERPGAERRARRRARRDGVRRQHGARVEPPGEFRRRRACRRRQRRDRHPQAEASMPPPSHLGTAYPGVSGAGLGEPALARRGRGDRRVDRRW